MAWVFFFQERNPNEKEKCSEIFSHFCNMKENRSILWLLFLSAYYNLEVTDPFLEMSWSSVLGTQKRQRVIYLKLARRSQIEFRGIYVCVYASKKSQDGSRISVISKSHPFFYVVTATILTFLPPWMILVESMLFFLLFKKEKSPRT